MQPPAHAAAAIADPFPADAEGLPPAGRPVVVELADGAEVGFRIAPVSKRIGDATVRMLAFGGSIPGPTLRVRQGSEVVVHVRNDGDLEQTVHWHGLRVENRFDGTHETQAPIEVGGSFAYRLRFPDPGVYWYHPHVREDYGQELGLYGVIVVEPADDGYWAPVDRELTLTLDDVLLEDGALAPFSRTGPTHVAMGRFGDTMLANGETDLRLDARLGEVVRLHLVNTANTRVFNLGLDGARMKLVGGDGGRVEQEALVDEVLLAPSERAVVDVLFDRAGAATLEHHSPQRCHPLARIAVAGAPAASSPAAAFATLRRDAGLAAERERIAPYLAAEPDRTLAFVAEMAHTDHHHHGGATADGIEWEDEMVEANRASTPSTIRWKLVDRTPGSGGAENERIDWRFAVGDRVKLRLVNDPHSDHPMHHPFHVHGAGQFLVLARDGAVEPNLAWKDTVLVRAGETVDILLDVTNPGVWMAHCHIAEHHEGGMMLSFEVV